MMSLISEIFFALSEIDDMVSITLSITFSPFCADVVALNANWLAWRELSAFFSTVVLICSMLATVCCSALACSSVREERSVLPVAISLALTLMVFTAFFTEAII